MTNFIYTSLLRMITKHKCECCGKDATCHVTLIKDNVVMTQHYCAEHAKERGVDTPKSFAYLDAGEVPEGVLKSFLTMACPKCHYTIKNFESTGVFGCPECFKAFEPLVNEILGKLHRGTKHRGKIPKKGVNVEVIQKRIKDLERNMKNAIAEEHYEEAAQIRDEISALKTLPDVGKS